MGPIYPTILRVISPTIGSALGLPYGTGVLLPPIPDNLLVWLKGLSTTDDTAKLDSWAKPDRENMVLSQSAAIAFNGVAEYGTLDTAITLSGDFEVISAMTNTTDYVDNTLIGDSASNHIKFRDTNRVYVAFDDFSYINISVSPALPSNAYTFKFKRVGTIGTVYVDDVAVGSATVPIGDFLISKVALAMIGQYFEGNLWNLRLKDSTQDIHFPLAEVNGLTSWDTTGTHSITWTPGAGGIEGMRAARQDSYHYNTNFGWYEIAADTTYYPYPVTGYTTHHKAGTMNYPESLMAFEEKPVGSPDGISDEILLPFNVPVDGSIAYDGTTTATLDIINNKITMTAGTIRNIVVSGTLPSQLNPDGSAMLNPDGSAAVNP